MRNVLAPALFAVVALSACSTAPIVSREKMTLGEANIEGMECRREKDIETNIPRTICASPEAWARFDARRRQESSDLLAEGRKLPNTGRYNRN